MLYPVKLQALGKIKNILFVYFYFYNSFNNE